MRRTRQNSNESVQLFAERCFSYFEGPFPRDNGSPLTVQLRIAAASRYKTCKETSSISPTPERKEHPQISSHGPPRQLGSQQQSGSIRGIGFWKKHFS